MKIIILMSLLLISFAFSQTKDKDTFMTKELLIELKQDIKELKQDADKQFSELKRDLKELRTD